MKKRLSLLLSLAAALGLMFSSAGSPGITPAQAAETGTTQTTTVFKCRQPRDHSCPGGRDRNHTDHHVFH